jgi:hypothetical protein
MRKFLMISAAAAAVILAAPVASMAQGVTIDTPVGGVRIGEPNYYHPSWGYAAPRYRYYEHDAPVVVEKRVYRDRDEWRDRDVGLRRWDRGDRWDRD